MFLNPAILALFIISITCTLLIVLASVFALQVVRYWDINSGHGRQLLLERRTYLISTMLTFCFGAELFGLLLLILAAESLSGQFVGAMCATGVLNVNAYGWWLLFVKIALFFFGSSWLIVNALDNRAIDYPLTRVKYLFLLFLLPLVVTESTLLMLYIVNLSPDLITSCCGSLFSATGSGVAAEVSAITAEQAKNGLMVSGVALFLSGVFFIKSGKGALLYSLISIVAYVLALLAMVSLVGLYVYEHPHHHCPFCVLKGGYGFAGYLLYIPLFAATAMGISVLVVQLCRNVRSLRDIAPGMAHHLAGTSLFLFLTFYALAGLLIWRSHLVLAF